MFSPQKHSCFAELKQKIIFLLSECVQAISTYHQDNINLPTYLCQEICGALAVKCSPGTEEVRKSPSL